MVKKVTGRFLALVLALCMAAACAPVDVKADMEWASQEKAVIGEIAQCPAVLHIPVKEDVEEAFYVTLMKYEEYDIRSVKSDSKNLKVACTGVENANKDKEIEEAYYLYGLRAKKKGTYELTVTVAKKDGSDTRSMTVKVYANDESPFQYLKLNGKKVSYKELKKGYRKTYFSRKKIKLQVKAAKGYKIDEISVCTWKNKEAYGSVWTQLNCKQIKSGDTFRLSNVKRYDNGGMDKKPSSLNKCIERSLGANTGVQISYIDKYTGSYRYQTLSFDYFDVKD